MVKHCDFPLLDELQLPHKKYLGKDDFIIYETYY